MSAANELFSITLPATRASLAMAAALVEPLATRLNFDDRDAFRVGLTIEEACTNVIDHAYAPGVSGDFTLRGVTKTVVFNAEFLGATDAMGGKAGFAATTVINRRDYGILWNKTLDNGNFMLGDMVTITLNVEANAPAKK